MLGRRAPRLGEGSAQVWLPKDAIRIRPSNPQLLRIMVLLPVRYAPGRRIGGTRWLFFPQRCTPACYFCLWRGAGLPDFAPSAWISSCSRFITAAIRLTRWGYLSARFLLSPTSFTRLYNSNLPSSASASSFHGPSRSDTTQGRLMAKSYCQ